MPSSRVHQNHTLLFFLVVGSLLMVAGCGTPLPRIQHTPIETLPFKAEREGILVALKPAVEKEELERNFGNDLVSMGILPILIKVSNQSAGTNFIVEGNNFTLNKDAGRGSREVLPSLGVPIWLGSLGGVVGAVVGGTIAANRSNSKVSMALAQFRSYTVSPGRSAQGFLFFQLPENVTHKDTDWRLQVKVNAIEMDHDVELEIPFSLKRITSLGDQK